MSVYVDDMALRAAVTGGRRALGGRWSHLMADSTQELLDFAGRTGPAAILAPTARHTRRALRRNRVETLRRPAARRHTHPLPHPRARR